MQLEGPILESLTRRLAETPEDFLGEPRIGHRGSVQTAAVVGDLLRILGGDVRSEQLKVFTAMSDPDRNRLGVTLILCWLLADVWFQQAKLETEKVLQILTTEAAELATQVASRKFVTESDRRNEMARLALARLGFRPFGETVAQAQDRLTTLSSTERARVVKAAKAAEQRARQIREALAKKAAEESADKFTRE
jgi:hypothetical protein